MAASTTTLAGLPPQELPRADLRDAVFVTIWLFSCLAFAGALYLTLKKRRRTWSEFRDILTGALLLALWYVVVAVDRWIHYDRRSVLFGYIIVAPVFEPLRFSSAIFLNWGTYKVVWRELEHRFPQKQKGYSWFGAQVALFIVILVSLYDMALYLALAVVWMKFFSLNTIADVASKRAAFEVARAAFFFVFGVLTVMASTATTFFQAKRESGSIANSRIPLFAATAVLLLRSTFELGIITQSSYSLATRHSIQTMRDIAYGLLTCIFFGLMCRAAFVVSAAYDPQGKEADVVGGFVRATVLAKLRAESQDRHGASRPFGQVLAEVKSSLDIVLAAGPPISALSLTQGQKRMAAMACLENLGREYGGLDPRRAITHSRSHGGSRSVPLFGRTSSASSRKGGPSTARSDPDMRRTWQRTSPGGASPTAVRRLPLYGHDPIPEGREEAMERHMR